MKNISQRVIDIGLPIVLFLIFFQFYNFGKITPSEMVKTTGLLAISLLSITLLVGPLSKIFPFFNILKIHRKIWGISSFLAALAHVILVFIYYFKFDFFRFIDVASPKYLATLSGILALVILLIVTLTSNKNAIDKLGPRTWKFIQTTSYIALVLAICHFYLIESVNGALVIKRLLGQITFWFSLVVIFVRVAILLLPK